VIHFRVVLQARKLSGIHARRGEVRPDHNIGPELCTIMEQNYIKGFGRLPKGKPFTEIIVYDNPDLDSPFGGVT
jgi:hypothetical protein